MKGDQYCLPNQLDEMIDVSRSFDIGCYFENQCIAIESKLIETSAQYQLFPLKLALQQIDLNWFGAATRAYQIIQWDCNHTYCGKCGAKVQQVNQQFEKRCEHCLLSFYPKLSPAIIVLIKKGSQILMARQKHFPEGVYGLIAGFVEAGETLEAALHREVYEEVGISVKNIRYYGSQPWPFPDSLMIAFTAEYDAGEINCPDGELEEAGWFDAENMPGFPSASSSIARHLIDDYLVRK